MCQGGGCVTEQSSAPPAAARPAARRPRLADVAARGGVSSGLVSLVLRNQPGPSAQTRARVLEAAQELGYRADRMASLLARRHSRHLGVLMDVRNTFHAELVTDLDAAATGLGYDLVLSTLTPTRDERRAAEILLDFRCEALILLGPDEPAGRLNALGRELSVVGYDDSALARLAHVDLTTVSQDARGQAGQAVALAVERLEAGRAAPREVVLTPHLVVRSTTAPPRR